MCLDNVSHISVVAPVLLPLGGINAISLIYRRSAVSPPRSGSLRVRRGPLSMVVVLSAAPGDVVALLRSAAGR